MSAQRVITVEELRALKQNGTHVRLAGREQARSGKFNSTRIERDGEIFDSRAELGFKLYLDYLIKLGVVLWYTRQVPFFIPGKPRAKRWRCDFLVVMVKGGARVVDVKGEETPLFKLKKSCIQHAYNFTIELVPARTNGDYSWT